MLHRLWRIVRQPFAWRRREADLEEEIRFHLAEEAEEHIAQGMEPDEAALAARRDFGNVLRIRDEVRDVWLRPGLHDLSQDVRLALRLLARDRRFTVAAATALALAIGANTTAFTLVNGILLPELPFASPERIVELRTETPRGQRRISEPDYEDVRSATRTISELAALLEAPVNLSGADQAAERVSGVYTTGNLFRVLGQAPALGRDFDRADDRPGADPVALISYRLWQTRYAADPAILGRAIRRNGEDVAVIGVMPRGMRFPDNSDIWLPRSQLVAHELRAARQRRAFRVVGRLANDATLDQAQAEMRAIGDRLAEEHPETNAETAVSVRRYLAPDRNAAALLLSIQASVAFVLLIACANVANLLLARAFGRSREVAVRASLGASRWRVVRQLLVESLVLALLAGAAGFGLAILGVRWLQAMTTSFGMPYWMEFSIDRVELGFVLGTCVATTLLFGLVPALHVASADLLASIRSGGGPTGGRRERRWVRGLVIAEIALTLVVISGAGMMMRSFFALYGADRGVDTTQLLTLQAYLPPARYEELESRVAFFRRLQEHLDASPAIEASALVTEAPLGGGSEYEVEVAGRAAVEGPQRLVHAVGVGDRYFETLGLRLLSGRGFVDQDGTVGHRAAIVNRRFVSLYFPDSEPVGEQLRLEPGRRGARPAGVEPHEWFTIVGVAPDVPLSFDEAVQRRQSPMVYLPHRTEAQRFALLLVRSTGDPASVAKVVRGVVRELEPDLPLYNVRTMDERLAHNWEEYEMFGSLFAAFGMIALVLSAVGVYAVTAHSVTRRVPELGVRIALGAAPGGVRWLVLRAVAVQLALGLLLGAGGAVALGRLLQHWLVGTSPTDLATLVPAVLILAAVAAAACLGPVRRAGAISPIASLRAD